MRKNIKIIVAVMCVLVVGASLVGCSCSSTDNKTNSTTSQSANGKNGTANSKDANNTNASANNNASVNNGANANANNGANANANNSGSGNSAAPAAPESKGTGIVGTFRYVDAETPELTSSYTFNQDGTGQYELLGEKLDLTYKTNGNILSIMFAGQNVPMDVEYTVNAQALTIKDVTGGDVVYHRV